MTIEELKRHCIRSIQMCESIERLPNVRVTDNRSLQEHKLVLTLIEAWEKVKEDLFKMATESLDPEYAQCYRIALCCVDGHLKEVSDGNS